jgi:hypothetical protein
MKLGDAFLMSVPPDFDREHLWFVISDPSKHDGHFIIVNVTTDIHRAGNECVLGPGDHNWISEECFVTFSDALEITPETAQCIEALKGTKVTILPCLTPQVLSKVVKAAKQSKAIPIAYKKYL